MSYWRKLESLFDNCLEKKDFFNLDIDGKNKRHIKSLAKMLRSNPLIEKVKVSRNIYKYKHYHMRVTLKEPLEIWKLLTLRMFYDDDAERVKFDITRINKGILDSYDYLGQRKIIINFDDNTTRKVSDYEPTGI